MSGFLKNFLIIIGGIVAGILALAFFFQYGMKYIRKAGSGLNSAGASTGVSMPFIVGAVALILVALWVGVSYARPSSIHSLEPTKGDLKKTSIVGMSSDLMKGFYGGSGGGSFGTYLYITNYDKTALVGTNSNNPIVKIGGTRLYVNNNNDGYTTYLEVDCVGGKKERVVLEDFPVQKWVYLTVNREGRRFTVYYNGAIAGSKVLDTMYEVRGDALRIGGTGYKGTYVYPNFNETVMREEDIRAYMRDTSDTKGEPFLPRDFWASLGDVSVFCNDGEGLLCSSSSMVQAPSGYKFVSMY